ncbi:MAG: Fe-S cluster assembly protein SufD [Rhodothalassiaceae bacterium]|nr:MAG: Fe-S cluster assembly protein SufD [Rhodothalassiaceae bacterium]
MRPLPEGATTAPANRAAAGVADLGAARAADEWFARAPVPEDERALRRRLFHAAAEAGLPGPKVEAWRYADLKDLAPADFLPGLARSLHAVEPEAGDAVPALRFLDGHCVARPDEEICGTIHDPAGTLPPAGAEGDDDAVWLLARAFATHGIDAAVAAGSPRRLALHSTARDFAAHGLSRVRIADGAEAFILLAAEGRSRAASERLRLELGRGAQARVLVVQQVAADAHHFLRIDASLGAAASLELLHVTGGTGFARGEHRWRLAGEDARATLSLAALPHDGGHADIFTRLEHAAGRTVSRQSLRALAGAADRAAWQGLVHVAHGADGTDARQDAKGLLLARGGEIDLKPELEIFADEIACAHGATVGELDPLAFFYLLARGLPPREARRMLIHAFVADVLAAWPAEDPFAGASARVVEAALARLSEAADGRGGR